MAYPRRILLAVTGLSPQIVTETLYALGVASDAGHTAFSPTEIHLITTEQGSKIARTALLHPDGGQFHALLADYPALGRPRFDPANIHVIQGADGPQAQLHIPIAGGRKTMGFYLGYAFSLFARPQDELSHVLVSSPFESHPEFFFPPATPRRLATRDGLHVDTADARITLARIPVVRLRHGQPQALLDGRASFGDTVAAIQHSLQPPHLLIQLDRQRVECGGQAVQLSPALLAWLAWWAQQTLQGRGPQNWRSADAAAFLKLYRSVVGIDAVAYENTQKRLAGGMEKEFFEQNNSKLERALKSRLGLAAAPYLLATSGQRPHTARSLQLQSTAIDLRG